MLVLLTSLLLPLQYSFSSQDIKSIEYFDNRYLLTRGTPTVCFHEPEEFNNGQPTEVLYESTREAINNWISALERDSGEQDVWNINLRYIENSTSYGKPTQWFMKECNVNIIFAGASALNINDGSYFKGGARHLSGSSTFSDIILYTWDYYPVDPRTLNMTQMKEIYGADDMTKFYEVRPTNKETITKTLEHELGHAFGLKHMKLNGKEDYYNMQNASDQAKLSIMYYATTRNVLEYGLKEITKFDTMAIMTKYSTDGWSGVTNLDTWQYKTIN